MDPTKKMIFYQNIPLTRSLLDIIPIPSRRNTLNTLNQKYLPERAIEQAKLSHEVPSAPIFTASLSCKTQTTATSHKAHHQTILVFYPPTSTCPALPFSKSTKHQGTSTFNGCCPSPIRWLIHLAPYKVQFLSFPYSLFWYFIMVIIIECDTRLRLYNITNFYSKMEFTTIFEVYVEAS